ncbi:head completion/stabilization protein [Burkholderia metallica]|uniref:head completion/stabilization protein n=1 Tax=Burkholderia metallica TaxID=488729 RepID=UPI001CF20A24|nr:head completion/stabilization protein [Burkholderia metallica]MCA8021246.1 head completion/stabilization protein [Burkholderia metallica]
MLLADLFPQRPRALPVWIFRLEALYQRITLGIGQFVHARDTMRLDGSITDARLRHELLAAIAEVNDELRSARATWRDAGITCLADVPADQFDGESVRLQHYRRAAYCLAKATLIERYSA